MMIYIAMNGNSPLQAFATLDLAKDYFVDWHVKHDQWIYLPADDEYRDYWTYGSLSICCLPIETDMADENTPFPMDNDL